MTNEKIRENLHEGKYDENHAKELSELKLLPADHILDEEKTVRWNREEVQRINARIGKKITELKKQEKNSRLQFDEDCRRWLADEFGFSEDAASLLFSFAWEDGHSFGKMAVFERLEEMADRYFQLKAADN